MGVAEGRRRVIDNEESNESVLEREEEILAISGEREFVTVGVGGCDRVCERLKNVGG